MLDVGTDNKALLDDPLYLGYRHSRVRGPLYEAFVDRYISTAHRLFPSALLHWEDFGASNARWILDTYRSKFCTFNDDVQGTGGIVLASILSALKITGTRLRDQKIVIFGAGTAGCGIADLLVGAIVNDGLSKEEAARRLWCVGRHGLIMEGTPNIRGFQAPYTRSRAETSSWKRNGELGISLEDVVREVHPTILIGSSGQSGAFTMTIVKEMAKELRVRSFSSFRIRPRLPRRSHGSLPWTDGRALIATGSPFASCSTTARRTRSARPITR